MRDTQPFFAAPPSIAPPLPPGRPITERMLERLPGRRWAWMVAWAALLPVVLLASESRGSLGGAWHLAARGDWPGAGRGLWTMLVSLGPAMLAMTYAIPHALWAIGTIDRGAAERSRALADVQLDATAPVILTRGFGSIRGPVGIAGALAALATVAVMSWRGPGYLALAPAFVIVLLPQSTLLWVYLCLMLGLYRLGSHPLALEQYSGDKSLGLRPAGQVAFSGFGAFVSNFAPLGLLAFGGRSGVDLVIVSAFLLLGTFAIFGSLLRMRAQMAAAKRKQVARARQLYADAYEPLRISPSLGTLERQAPLLAAAEALEKRAEAIQKWPFSDALLARAVVIATSVLVAVLTRLAQRFLGV